MGKTHRRTELTPAVQPPTLKRTITLTQLVFYGAGTILGAGIYVLVGEVAARGGLLSPLAFVAAAIIVAFSAYSFAVLAKRYPVSAGEAAYVQAAFGKRWLANLVGFAIIFVGITSSATIARGFHGYLFLFVPWPDWLAIALFVSLLTGVALWGIGLSVRLAVAATVVEIIGLLLVIVSAGDRFDPVLAKPADYFVPLTVDDWRGLGLAAYLAFYACIGFEDMVNMAEEVENPERNLPLGIGLVLAITTALYVLVTLAALVSVPLAELANSHAPLALVIERNGLVPLTVIGFISAVAVTNGALIQIIMGSRVLYGMASRQLLPAFLARIHPRTRTPWAATFIVGATVLIFALLLPLQTLAMTTSTIVLAVFTLVNLALLRLNLRDRRFTAAGLGMPLAGAILCLSFMTLQLIA